MTDSKDSRYDTCKSHGNPCHYNSGSRNRLIGIGDVNHRADGWIVDLHEERSRASGQAPVRRPGSYQEERGGRDRSVVCGRGGRIISDVVQGSTRGGGVSSSRYRHSHGFT